MDLYTWAIFALAFTGATLIPGPAMLLALKDGMERGAAGAIPGILGVIAAGIIWASVSLSGLSLVLQSGTVIFRIFRTVGAVYLIWLGLRMLLAKGGDSREEDAPEKGEEGRGNLFRRGFLVGISNVKAIIFFGAFFPQFLDPKGPVLVQYGILLSSLCVLIFLCMMAYSVTGGTIAPLLRRERVRRGVDRVSGGLFIAFGTLLAFKD